MKHEQLDPRNKSELGAQSTGGFREILQTKQEQPITPAGLLSDNRENARERLEKWEISRIKGTHVATKGCGDAREEIPDDENSERIQSIATGGSIDPFDSFFKSRNIQAAVNLTHHDGDTVMAEQMPRGCGGLGAKEEVKKNGTNGDEVAIYAENSIDHEDTIIQSCRSALRIFALNGKPIMAATQDHITGEIHPVLALWNRGNTRLQALNRLLTLDDLTANDIYSPEKIYQEGLPCIDFDALPEVFQEYLAINRKEIEKLYELYPDYKQRQKTQNPSTIFLTTDIRPVRLKFPDSFHAPGSFFRLTIPRKTFGSGEDRMVEIDEDNLEIVFSQAKYPITHFDRSTTIIFETPSNELSVSFAKKLLEKPLMEKWKEKKGSQVIAIESQAGKVIRLAHQTF